MASLLNQEELPDYLLNKEKYLAEKQYRSKNGYDLKYNGTKLDNFLIELKNRIDTIFWGYRVSGLGGKPKHHWNNEYDQDAWISFKGLDWSETDKPYSITIEINPLLSGFKETHKSWVEEYFNGVLKKGKIEDYRHNTELIYEKIKDILFKHTTMYAMNTFFGIASGNNPWRCYVYLDICLKIDGFDIFHQCSTENITEFGMKFYSELASEFKTITEETDIDLDCLYRDKDLRNRLARLAENNFRNKIGVSNVGDSYVNETYLFQLLKKSFGDVEREWSPAWLKRKRIDFYVPKLNLAIEYHGIQHYSPVEYFGGDKKFEKQLKRDSLVRELCRKNNVFLEEWPYFRPISMEEIQKLTSKYFIS